VVIELSRQRSALIVDPDPDFRRLYALYFSAHGWTVDDADDGRVALAKSLAQHPLIVVTELRLPGMSGFDLCKRLRSDDSTVGTIVIAVSHEPARADQARTSGADEFCVKPCPPDALLQVMERLLGKPRPGPVVADEAATPASDPRRKALTRTHVRQWTTTPPRQPPALVCPRCDTVLSYVQSHVGGVSVRRPEQWDYFACPQGCGEFQYRQTTRVLRPAAASRIAEHAHTTAD
jgi:CheY-like chemotaxis protein